MRIDIKKSLLVTLAFPFGMNAFLNAQTCQISKEWPADSGLRDVLIDRADQSLSPAFSSITVKRFCKYKKRFW